MWYSSEVGKRCHWCGEFVPGNAPKTGNHVFCKNRGRCKMAHARAYKLWQQRKRNVTPILEPGGDQANSAGRKSNRGKRD